MEKDKFSPQEISKADLLKAYPYLERWLEENQDIELQNGNKLPGALEKIELLGGIERIKMLTEEEEDQKSASILLSCRNTPLTGYHIYKFMDFVDQHTPLPSLYFIMDELIDTGKLKREDVIMLKNKNEENYIIKPTIGYVTIIEGHHVNRPGLLTSIIGNPLQIPKLT